jgi:hypothetical protein
LSAVTDPLTEGLLEALDSVQRSDAEYGALVGDLKQRLGEEWWARPEAELRGAAEAIAAERGLGRRVADTAERGALTTLIIRRFDAIGPGMERPAPRELLERAFLEVVQDRYGSVTPLAADVGRREFRLDL